MASILQQSLWVFPMLLFISEFRDVTSHGGMLEPPMRSIAWRYGFDSPVNYDWMALYCGGLHTFQQNGGRCGLCGDPYRGPFENDRGGVYDTGVIVRHYPVGLREIEVKVELTAHHKGYFRFKMCPNNENALTEECLDRYPLQIREGRSQGDPFRYYPAENPKLYELHVELPAGVTCDRCVLQWTYTAGNSAGQDRNGRSCLGCGIQETFVNCADISIGGTRDRMPVAKGTNNTRVGGPTIVLPPRTDLVNVLRNAPADHSLQDFMQDFGQRVGQPRQTPERGFQNGAGSPSHSWREASGSTWQDGGREQSSNLNNVLPNNFDGSASNFDPLDISWRTPDPVLNFDPIIPPSTVDHHFDINTLRGDNSAANRAHSRGHLDFAGINDPTTLQTLNNHFSGHAPISHGEASRGFHTSRDRIPTHPAQHDNFQHLNPFDRLGQTPKMENSDVITSQGHHSTLLGSLSPLVSEINNRRRHGNGNFRSSSIGIPGHSRGGRVVASEFEAINPVAFGRQPHGALSPGSRHFQSAHARTSFPSHSMSQSFPSPHRLHDSGLGMEHSGFSLQTPGSEFHQHERTLALRDPSTRLSTAVQHYHRQTPRKIVVHSMEAAQHLLRRYPELRGRVFLSRRAHRLNSFAHTVSKYRHRGQW